MTQQVRCVEVRRRVAGGCEVAPVTGSGCERCAGGGGCQGAWLNRLLPVGRGVVLPIDAPVGHRLLVSVDERALARASWFAYGLLLLGLFGGAFLGVSLLGTGTGLAHDLAALGGAFLGVTIALRACRRLPRVGLRILPSP